MMFSISFISGAASMLPTNILLNSFLSSSLAISLFDAFELVSFVISSKSFREGYSLMSSSAF